MFYVLVMDTNIGLVSFGYALYISIRESVLYMFQKYNFEHLALDNMDTKYLDSFIQIINLNPSRTDI